VGGTLVSGTIDPVLWCVKDLWWYNTTMHNKYKKYYDIYNTDMAGVFEFSSGKDFRLR